MMLINKVCITVLQFSGWLKNHDREVAIRERSVAIDEYLRAIHKINEYREFDLGDMYLLADMMKQTEGENNE